MTSRSLGHRAPLLWLVVPMIAGVTTAHTELHLSIPWLLGSALVAAVAAVIASWFAPRWTMVGVVAAMFFTGAANYRLRQPADYEWATLAPREARLQLRVDRIFTHNDQRHTVNGLATIVSASAPLHAIVDQKVYFSLKLRQGLAQPERSAHVGAIAVVEPVPRSAAVGSFEEYLSNAGINFKLTKGRILEIVDPPSQYQLWLAALANRMSDVLGTGVAEKRPDLTAIYRAMMLGQKHELSDDQKDLFMHSGTMHLFAINGLHIGVIALALHAVLAVLRCPRRIAAVVTLAVLWLDVEATGASPSAIRAWLLVAVAESAFVIRLPGNGLATLSAAALLLLVFDPTALFGASFQMSYGAVLAILAFGLPLAEVLAARWAPWKNVPEATWSRPQRLVARLSRWLWPVVGIGLATALVSAITGPEFFQVFAAGGFVTNLVLVPFVMLVIVAGFAALVTGLAGATWLCSLFNHAALLVLWLIDALIRLGAKLPAVWWPAQWLAPWMGGAALAVLLTTIVYGYAGRWRGWARGWWMPFAVVGLALILGVKFG